MSTLPAINWITNGTDFYDYRPAIGPDNNTVIFERGFMANKKFIQLYVTTLDDPSTVSLFIPGSTNVQTRPDWNWAGRQVVFNNRQLWIVNDDGTNPEAIAGTNGLLYPQWNKGGQSLTVMNNNGPGGNPNPCSSVISADGTMQEENVNGMDANNVSLYGGMPAANPQVDNLVAFAGQPTSTTWDPSEPPGYQQTSNYIFINSLSDSGIYSSSPMESGAPIDAFNPSFEGRAPAWSPDGNYILFESTRIDDSFALFLFNVNKQTVTQLTDPQFQVQHGKFFPDGKRIIVCGKPSSDYRNSIGWVDISALL